MNKDIFTCGPVFVCLSVSCCSCSPCLYCNACIYLWGLFTKPREFLVFAFASTQVLGLDPLIPVGGFASGMLCTVLVACFPLQWEWLKWLHVAAALCPKRLDDLDLWSLSAASNLHCQRLALLWHVVRRRGWKPFRQEDVILEQNKSCNWISYGTESSCYLWRTFPPSSCLRSNL